MGTMTIRFQDEKHQRLKSLAKEKGISLNKLMDELATIALVSHDTELHFKSMAEKGTPKRGLELLDKLDFTFENSKENPAK